VATIPAVREKMVLEQQRIGAEHGNLVAEGRDQGSVVFPGAELKIYLDRHAARAGAPAGCAVAGAGGDRQ